MTPQKSRTSPLLIAALATVTGGAFISYCTGSVNPNQNGGNHTSTIINPQAITPPVSKNAEQSPSPTPPNPTNAPKQLKDDFESAANRFMPQFYVGADSKILKTVSWTSSDNPDTQLSIDIIFDPDCADKGLVVQKTFIKKNPDGSYHFTRLYRIAPADRINVNDEESLQNINTENLVPLRDKINFEMIRFVDGQLTSVNRYRTGNPGPDLPIIEYITPHPAGGVEIRQQFESSRSDGLGMRMLHKVDGKDPVVTSENFFRTEKNGDTFNYLLRIYLPNRTIAESYFEPDAQDRRNSVLVRQRTVGSDGTVISDISPLQNGAGERGGR
ncbi:MAG: hypothetical protein EYC62_02885 [Alphaproteobacteria bacterium]|nr:MAG: hypothetical protein EYC62_02885 [Alphaproteobacteria bacterium]